MYKKLEKCLKSIRKKTDFKPEKAVILGSGLGDYAEKIKIEKVVKYTDIEDFPVSTVQGHKGQFVFGYVKDVPVVLMQGRVHYYEGYSMQDVVLPTRLMGVMGAKKILLTNAAGGVNPSFRPGDFMLITDHITTAVLGRRRSRYEYCMRSHGSQTYGNGSVRNLLHYEYGSRRQ